ncbi:hypothetical protein crov123 [Cafeteria roenbergensis virus]|uniref:FNIP repeat-containing protein n=1 Tax=Cafeteria roenbergensis virus (strain BV-PW1) TaxID=693272 RepID=E3T4P3_CROVB|nr:hypothetical protein crov123 [Cafeteria roenbergensis virus BV-PW1]ADO67156.1 hypothetical protein crov123 [Cafeteria roenbergensis virus BV-PW1]
MNILDDNNNFIYNGKLVQLPKLLTNLTINDKNQLIIKNIILPELVVTQIKNYNNNNNLLTNVEWPKSLTSLTFGWNFNQPIDKVAWSNSLLTLIFGNHFNKSIENVIWPESLTSLTFGYNFDQPMKMLYGLNL